MAEVNKAQAGEFTVIYPLAMEINLVFATASQTPAAAGGRQDCDKHDQSPRRHQNPNRPGFLSAAINQRRELEPD